MAIIDEGATLSPLPESVPDTIGGWTREVATDDRISYTHARDVQSLDAGHGYAITRFALTRSVTGEWEITRRQVSTRLNVDWLRSVSTVDWPDLQALVHPGDVDGDSVITETFEIPAAFNRSLTECWQQLAYLLDTVYPTRETIGVDHRIGDYRLDHWDGYTYIWLQDRADEEREAVVLSAAGLIGWIVPATDETVCEDLWSPGNVTRPIQVPYFIDPDARYEADARYTRFSSRRGAFETVEHLLQSRS
jgi:hypothetical protein